MTGEITRVRAEGRIRARFEETLSRLMSSDDPATVSVRGMDGSVTLLFVENHRVAGALMGALGGVDALSHMAQSVVTAFDVRLSIRMPAKAALPPGVDMPAEPSPAAS